MNKWFFGITLVLALASCGTQVPQLQQPAGNDAVVVKKTTKVLGTTPRPGINAATGQRYADEPQQINELEGASPDLSVITFDGGSAYAQGLQPGDVIAAPPNQVASEGFLRRVSSVQDYGSEVQVYTEESDLDEAIDYADTDQGVDLEQNDITSVQYADGRVLSGNAIRSMVKPQGSVTLRSINIPIPQVKICEGDSGTQITASGSFSASLRAFLNVKFHWFSLRRAETGIQADQSLNLKMSGTCRYELFRVEYPVARINFGTKVLFVGPVPVVITPYVNVNIGANGNITLQASFDITQRYNGRFGVLWEKGRGFTPIKESSFTVTGLDSISASASLNVTGYLLAEAGMKFYGIAYVYARARPYLEFNGTLTLLSTPGATIQRVSTQSTPSLSYTLYAGLKVGVGGRIRIFGKTLGEWNSPEYEVFRSLIASGNTGGGTPPAPSPPAPDPVDPPEQPPCPGCALQ
jgi:hypothetical protein